MTRGFFTRAGYSTLILTILIIMVVALAARLAAPPAVLIVQEHQSGKVLFKKPMQLNETFTLYYIHSITKQPVKEIYYVRDMNTLALKEMHYDSFGSNLPVGPEHLAGEDTKFTVEEGYYKITYEKRVFDRVPLRVGKVIADHRLLFRDGTCLRFLDVVQGGSYVDFYVQPFKGFYWFFAPGFSYQNAP